MLVSRNEQVVLPIGFVDGVGVVEVLLVDFSFVLVQKEDLVNGSLKVYLEIQCDQ